jgi:hypothetical protein
MQLSLLHGGELCPVVLLQWRLFGCKEIDPHMAN